MLRLGLRIVGLGGNMAGLTDEQRARAEANKAAALARRAALAAQIQIPPRDDVTSQVAPERLRLSLIHI